MVVVCLVEEHVLPVLNPIIIGSVFLQDATRTDAVLPAELLPELGADCVKGGLLWLPHCPIWMVIISLGIVYNVLQFEFK